MQVRRIAAWNVDITQYLTAATALFICECDLEISSGYGLTHEILLEVKRQLSAWTKLLCALANKLPDKTNRKHKSSKSLLWVNCPGDT